MIRTSFDIGLRESRLCANAESFGHNNFHNGGNFNHPGTFHNGRHFNNAGNFQNGRHFNNNFQNRNFHQNHHFNQHHNFQNFHHQNQFHFNQHQNSFWYHHENPTFFWHYENGTGDAVDHPTAEHLGGVRQDVLRNMRAQLRQRAGMLDRYNDGLDHEFQIPQEYAGNREFGRIGSRMLGDPASFEQRFGYPALMNDPRGSVSPFDRVWDRYRDQMDRQWSAPRNRGVRYMNDQWRYGANTPYARQQMGLGDGYLNNWGSMNGRQQGAAYNQMLNNMRNHYDVRPYQRDFLSGALNTNPHYSHVHGRGYQGQPLWNDGRPQPPFFNQNRQGFNPQGIRDSMQYHLNNPWNRGQYQYPS